MELCTECKRREATVLDMCEDCYRDSFFVTSDVAHIAKIDPPETVLTIQNNEGKKILQFMQDGSIYVHGRFAENDKEIVEAFKEFLIDQGYMH